MRWIAVVLALLASPVAAQDHAAIARRALENQILPGYAAFAGAADALAQSDCAGFGAAYQAAFDSWMAVSHLHFGPAETGDTYFAIAYWPDTRGLTPKALGAVLASDEALPDAEDWKAQSVAARGLYALDWLLGDPQFDGTPLEGRRCDLAQVVAQDLAASAEQVSDAWRDSYAARFAAPAGDDATAPTRALLTALVSGLETVKDLRLGRPLGTFQIPQPMRAEAWRTGRPERNLVLSLQALLVLFDTIAPELDQSLAQEFRADFSRMIERASALDDPLLAGVSDPQKRVRIEALASDLTSLTARISKELPPVLGVGAGFNANDGD